MPFWGTNNTSSTVYIFFLEFLIITVLIAAVTERKSSVTAVCAVPEPECYGNVNGFCRTFTTKCDAQNGNCGMKNSAMSKWKS